MKKTKDKNISSIEIRYKLGAKSEYPKKKIVNKAPEKITKIGNLEIKESPILVKDIGSKIRHTEKSDGQKYASNNRQTESVRNSDKTRKAIKAQIAIDSQIKQIDARLTNAKHKSKRGKKKKRYRNHKK